MSVPIRAALLLALILTCIHPVQVANASGFTHPAGAYAIEPPATWRTVPALDDRGLPFYVFTPDPGDDPDRFTQGLWLFAFPVPTNQLLKTDRLAVLVSAVLTGREPGLTVDVHAAQPVTLGSHNAVRLDVTGTRHAGPWRGQLIVAVQDDNFIVISYGSTPAQWNTIAPQCQQALNTLVAPVAPAVRDEPRLPVHPEQAYEVAARLTPACPLIHGVFRKQGFKSWGSGFIISPDGYVITNRHVVNRSLDNAGNPYRETYDPMRLTFDREVGEGEAMAEVVAVSYQYDLALLKIQRPPSTGGTWPFAHLVNFARTARGHRVVVMGWPAPNRLGETDLNLNEGSISTITHDPFGRVVDIRHSARTTAGNSGGPLYSLNAGGIVGVHYSGNIVQAHGFKENLYHGAVPASRVLWEFPQLVATRNDRKLSRPERHGLIAYYFLQERFGAAVLEARRALQDDPQDGIAHAYLFRIYATQGAREKAAAALQVALAQANSRKLATWLAGRAALETDDLKSAMQFGREAIQADPQDPEGYIITGYALLGMGQFDEARASFQHAAQHSLAPNAEVEANLGALPLSRWLVEQQVNKLPWKAAPPPAVLHEANVHLDRSLDLWPTRNWVAFHNRALIAALTGRVEDFDTYRSVAAQIDPFNPDAKLASAFLALLLNDPASALNKIEQAQDVRQSSRGYFLKGWAHAVITDVLAKTGESEAAINHLRQSVLAYALAAKTAPDASWASLSLQIAKDLAKFLPPGN